MNNKLIFIFTCLALIFLFIANVSADDLNSTDFDDLANDIATTQVNQTLTLHKDYQFKNASDKHIVIDKSMTIDGNNHTIDAPDVSRVFWIKADNVCIKNINFINSNNGALAGGVISWWGNNGTLMNCNFTNNSAVSAGGAVLWKGDSGVISNCNFENNHVKTGVAVILVEGDGYNKSQPITAQVNSEGGALFISGNNVLVNYCNFINNIAELNGGAISVYFPSNVTISNSRFKNNTCAYHGGAIDLNANASSLINLTGVNNSPNDLHKNCNNAVIIDSFKQITDNSFDELSRLINETSEGGILVLDKDYEFINGSNKGILISKSITIDGNGHTLNGNKLSRIFNVTANNVVVKNINFINGNAVGRYFSAVVGGGAIYWNGSNGFIENCNFTNNTGWGIEDDFDEEEIIDENGTVIHIVHVRPMGAKTNEGGAIAWNGTNGTVSKCIFIGNDVGYPNSGGAICWRGSNGKVLSCEFYSNSAWCGAAICWMGNNGLVYLSKVINQQSFDGGIYWFGNNGTVNYCILLSSSLRPLVRINDGSLNADYNFWGDTINDPKSVYKVDNVKTWFILNCTHYNEFLNKGTNLLVDYNINSLYDGGKIKSFAAPMNFSGQINFTAPKTGFLKIYTSNDEVIIKIDSKDKITSKNLKKYYSKETSFSVKVSDVLGNVKNAKVKFKVNNNVYYADTNSNGMALLKLNLKPGKYTIHTYYGDAKVKNKIVIKNTLITKNLSKKAKKSAKFKIKVLNMKGKAFKNQKVKIKFKGKTYNLKTNSKGTATFKVPKNLKVGKYKIKSIYNDITNVNKIIVKK